MNSQVKSISMNMMYGYSGVVAHVEYVHTLPCTLQGGPEVWSLATGPRKTNEP